MGLFYKISHTYREANQVVDFLANKAQYGDFLGSSKSVENFMYQVLIQPDAYGIHYARES